jgi:hypothetical protein
MRQQPDSPFRDGGFLASHSTPIRWVPRKDGSRQLELADICRLKRYTSAEANQCLADKHVSMIGDSVTRYQYISLAHFLEHGRFPPRFRRPPSPDGPCRHVDELGVPQCSPHAEPNVCIEKEWSRWDLYFQGLGGSTNGGLMNGRMECHSYRVEGSPVMEWNDNLLYSNGNSRAVLSFLFETGWGNNNEAPLFGFQFTNCSFEGTCRRTGADTDRVKNRTLRGDFDWRQTFPEAIDANGTLRAVLPKPDVAMVSRAKS